MDGDSRVGLLRAEVARFWGGLRDLPPELRLREAAKLHDALVEVADEALMAGMAAAQDAGWGLRKIGDVVGLSHEKVRYRLAKSGQVSEGT
ncbi:hypothetical protein [Streptomyces sp. NPDC002328]|uniref:hypothetical protein n=1 Tax=Streptomyces sp. NPDC002328 TaxID=3364642 RepID=UPI003679B6DE